MGTCARNRMVGDRFIADQRSCGLRCHPDSVPPDTPIAAGCGRFGTEEGSSPGTDLDRGHSGVSGDSRESTLFRENSLRAVGCPEVESRIPVPVASVVQSDIVGLREAGSGCNQDVPPGIMSSLIARLLRVA